MEAPASASTPLHPSIERIAAGIVRVTCRHPRVSPRPSLMVTAAPGVPMSGTGAIGHDDHPGLSVMRDPGTGALSFLRADGSLLLREAPGTRRLDLDPVAGHPALHLTQGWVLDPDEGLYGLGQHQEGIFNWRGHSCLLAPGNRQAALPLLVSSRGWGILWDADGLTRFRDDAMGMFLDTAAATHLDYYIIDGGTLDGVIAGYRYLTGAAPLFPRWALGYWQSRERYTSQAQFLDIAAEFSRRGLPLDCLVQDWAYWGPLGWNAMRFDAAQWPDPEAAMQQLHRHHRLKAMISVWPCVGIGTPVHSELAANNGLFTNIQHWGKAHVYDAFSPTARAIYGRHLQQGILDRGFDAIWLDGTEPEFSGAQGQEECTADILVSGDTAAGPWPLVLNAFAPATAGGVREAMLASHPQQRPVILSRSAWAGQQRHGVVTWSGDVAATWTVLRRQIAAGLNFSLAGIPWWTTDIGGFFTNAHGALFPDGCADPAYRELYVRWFQFGAFCPIFRSHGTNTPREPWQFGNPTESAYDAIADMLRLRYRLMPYLYALAWSTSARDDTPMRALVMDHPDDPAVRDLADQFMCGRALMACPITEPMHVQPVSDHAVVPEGDLRLPGGLGVGVLASYHDNPNWGIAVANRTEVVIDADWSGAPPHRITSQAWSVSWSGELAIAGRHLLVITSGGGVQVNLNGVDVIDEPDQAVESRWEIPLESTTGAPVPFTLKFRPRPGGRPGVRLGIRRSDGADGLTLAQPQRTVVLPQGCGWTDFWSGKRRAGGQTLTVPTPLGTVPLYLPDGAILPMGPDCLRAEDSRRGPLEIRICGGRDGSWTWYDDAGDGFAYRQNASTAVDFRWHDATRTLVISACTGRNTLHRELHVVLVRPGHGAGIAPTSAPDAVIAYDGTATEIRL